MQSKESVVLFVNARDEPSIHEWIAHHLNLGFNHIFVFDHKSIVPITVSKTVSKYVSVIRVNLPDGNIKIPLMNDAVRISKHNKINWMIYLDADEYIYLKNTNKIQQLLSRFINIDALSLNWVMFGSNNHIVQPPGLLVDNFTCSDKIVDKHIKMFVRPNKVKLCMNPHFYVTKSNALIKHISGSIMYPSPFFIPNKDYTTMDAFIAHYVMQSEHEFSRRKGRNMDDGSVNKNANYPDVHLHYNVCTNTLLRDKYSAEIKKTLKSVVVSE